MDYSEVPYLHVLEKQKTLFNEIFNTVEGVTTKENPFPQYFKSRLLNLGGLWEKCAWQNAFLKTHFPPEEHKKKPATSRIAALSTIEGDSRT